MYTQGPYTVATPGVAFAVTIDREASAVQIHNETPYKLYIQLDGAQPIAASSANGQYDSFAAPWSHPVIAVQRRAASGYERSLNAIRDFTGTIWIMPISVSANLATTGMASTLAEIHMDVYRVGERLPESWAMPRQQDVTSQPRVIAVPMSSGPGGVVTGRVPTPAAGASQSLANGWSVAVNAGVAGNVVSFYVYAVLITMGFNAAGAGGIDLSVLVDLQNAANVSLGFPWPQEFIRASLSWVAAAGPYDKLEWPQAPWPAAFVGSIASANADHLAILIKNQGSTNIPAQLDFTIMASIGQFGTNNLVQVPGPIGFPSSQGTLL